MYPTFYIDFIPVVLAVYALIKMQSTKVVDTLTRLGQFAALLLIVAQTTWIQSYLKGFDLVTSAVDGIWTIFNAVVMLIVIMIANRKDCLVDSINAKFKFVYALSQEKHESIFLLGVAALLLGLGFIFGTGNNQNHEHLYDFASPAVWAMLFITYGSFKFLGFWFDVNHTLRIINGVVGLWCWNYVALSFIVFDETSLAPTELLLFVPVIVEAWVLLSTVKLALGDKK